MSFGHDRIAVTGVGLVTALGLDAEITFRRLVGGECGFRPLTLLDVSDQRSAMAGEVTPMAAIVGRLSGVAGPASRCDAMALAAASEAIASSGLDLGRSPIVVAVGTTNAWMYEAEQSLRTEGEDRFAACARQIVAHPLAVVADRLAHTLGNVKRKATLCSACSSGALAIIQGALWLELGVADQALVGGVDSLSLLTFTGFGALGAMAPGPCRPFDLHRAGLTLGEGAGFLLLERESVALARGARIVAWLTGWSAGAEAHHITQPEPSGATAAHLMARALSRAGLEPGDIDYVNAHGTGTPPNDAMESLALHAAFGAEMERIWVSSSKGQLGHTLGAAGAVEAAVTTLAIAGASVPPTGGLTTPDPALKLRHVQEKGIATEVRAALSSSFGFGGSGAVLIFEHPDAPRRCRPHAGRSDLVISGAFTWTEDDSEPTVANLPRPAKALGRLDPNRSRRFDQGAALTTASAEQVLLETGSMPSGTGLVLGASHGHVDRSLRFLKQVVERGPRLASPADFPHLLPSSPAGNASVYLGLKGPVCMVSDPHRPGESALDVAAAWVEGGLAESLLVGSVAIADPSVVRAIVSLGLGKDEDYGCEAAAFVALESGLAAKQRGALPLARVVAAGRLFQRQAARALVREPRYPEQALLFYPAGVEGMSNVLSESAWLQVRRVTWTAPSGAHDSWGIAVLARAARLVFQGTAREVLVWAVGQDSVTLVQLEAWDAGEQGFCVPRTLQ